MLGAGTQANPYIIQTPQDLHDVRNKIVAGTYYELGNDIDMSSWGNFTPIGNTTNRFKGTFDGKGFKIKNLTISNSSSSSNGFFSVLEYATIKNVAFENANIITTRAISGIISGYSFSSRIENCYTTGQIEGTESVGGIIGRAFTQNLATDTIGTVVENCYSTATVKATVKDAGGLVGLAGDNKTYVRKSFATGQITSPSNGNALIGSYGTIPSTNFLNLYYNNQVLASQVGTGLTTEQFKSPSNFIGFDTAIWGFGTTPYLKIFGLPIRKITQTLTSHSEQIVSVLERSKRKLSVFVSHSSEIVSGLSKSLKTGVESFIDEIVSDADYTFRTARTQVINVESYVEQIDSSLNKSIRAKISLESESGTIESYLDVIIPIDENEVIVAYLSTLENCSSIIYEENQSSTSTIKNKSELQVI